MSRLVARRSTFATAILTLVLRAFLTRARLLRYGGGCEGASNFWQGGGFVTTRSELVRALHRRHPRVPLRDLDELVHELFEALVAALERGERVELRGFGIFSTALREKTLARNPRTGERVALPQRRVLRFRLGEALHKRLNPTPSPF